ncbi:MAG: Holliday junction branch migration protein RuvA [Bacteroidetes bacterium]|nr:MAG: Holliday junction branch migration protein RuvA [Bacteroidota bacterium]
MITHLEGKLIEKTPTCAIIDCNGVGYYLNITVNTYSKIENLEKCKLLTHVIVSQMDNSQNMYGFFDEQERSTFRHLISVSGVGAGTARVLLSSLSPAEVQQAISLGNVSVFRSIKGIGEKTAQRIIVDLNGKLTPLSLGRGAGGESIYNKTREEALKALLTLGFVKNLSEKAVDKALTANPELSVDQIVREALKSL